MTNARIVDRFGLVGTTLDRKFRIERVIAEGGFGILYYGTHLMLDRPIALKVLKTPPDFNEQAKATFIEGFAREAKTIVKISHANIVQVLDFGVTQMPTGEMAPWMVLEWLNGEAFRDVLLARRGQGGRSPYETLQLMRPALEALAYAHEEGIAHRDIKPANMMLVPTRRGAVLKLLDFGIAKVMEEGEEAGTGHTVTTSSIKAFSLAYAAPEQIGGSRTGPWTDVHAMALIVTEVLTDLPPYDGRERTEICCDALSARRPTPAKRNVDCGPWEPVLGKALALRPSDRFQTAGEFLTALEQAIGYTAPTNHPTGQYAAVRGATPGTMPPGMMMAPQAPPGMVPYGAMHPQPGMHTGPMHPQYGMQTGPMQPHAMMAPIEGDPSGNPTTLRGAATSRDLSGATQSGGSATRWIIAAGALVGVLGLGAAIAVQRSHKNAASAVTHAAMAPVPVVTPAPMPVVTPAPVVPAAPVVAPEPTAPTAVVAVAPTAPTAAPQGTAGTAANSGTGTASGDAHGAAIDPATGRRRRGAHGHSQVNGSTQLDVD